MRKLTSALFAAAIVLCTFSAQARLRRYKGWEQSPEGYYMTSGEREQWEKVQTDEDAQKFEEHFLSIRGGDTFAREVAKRGEYADKYLTIGKTPGSRSLRGKLIILLGPPSSVEVSQISDSRGQHHDSPTMAAVYTGGSASTPGDDISSEGARGFAGSDVTRDYHFKYGPPANLDIRILADGNSGKDRLANEKDREELERLFERAAEASIHADPAK